MQEKHLYTTALVDEERMDRPLVDLWEPEEQYPTPSFTSQSFQHVLIFALFCSNIFFAALAVFFYTNAQCPVLPQRLDPFSISAASRDARAHIRYEQRTFTGALKYNSTTGSLYRSTPASINSTEPSYVGNPRETPGLDRAWKDLLSGSRFPLSDDEVAPYLQKGLAAPVSAIKKPSSTVFAELDVFHSLSCLNAIRLALDDDFYAEHGPQDGLGWQRTTRSDREQLGTYLADFPHTEFSLLTVAKTTASTTSASPSSAPPTSASCPCSRAPAPAPSSSPLRRAPAGGGTTCAAGSTGGRSARGSTSAAALEAAAAVASSSSSSTAGCDDSLLFCFSLPDFTKHRPAFIFFPPLCIFHPSIGRLIHSDTPGWLKKTRISKPRILRILT